MEEADEREAAGNIVCCQNQERDEGSVDRGAGLGVLRSGWVWDRSWRGSHRIWSFPVSPVEVWLGLL